MTTRRQFLTQATLPVAAAVAFTVPAALVRAEVNPDAELLAAWERYCALGQLLDQLEYRYDPDLSEPYETERVQVQNRIESLSARTAEGVLVKLRYLLVVWAEDAHVESRIEAGLAPDAAVLDSDFRWRLHWNLIDDLERMASA